MKNILIDKHTSKFEEVKTSKKPGVLATIRGAVSGWKPNRNGRTYSRELWKKAINSDFVREQIALKHFIGEADHPEDRLDPAFEHMSHAISDFEFRDDRSELWATIDILDTPDGQKLKTLLDYSGSLSFSTRGSGDVMENGEVDPDTYQLFAIDSVIRPSYPTATVLAESENLGNLKTITESEALKVLEAYSGNAYSKKSSARETSMKDDLFMLNHRSLFESLNEGENDYTRDDLDYVISLVDEYANQTGLDDDEVYDRVKSMLRDTDLENNDYVIWDAMAYVIDNNMGDDDMIDSDEEDYYESEDLNEFFGKKKKQAPKQNNGGDPSKCGAIEDTLMIWFGENTEDMMDRYVDCKANEEGFSYVITVKSPYIGRYNLFDEYDVMDYADEAGKYIADRLKIEYVKSVKVNDRTFKIYLDNYYTA